MSAQNAVNGSSTGIAMFQILPAIQTPRLPLLMLWTAPPPASRGQIRTCDSDTADFRSWHLTDMSPMDGDFRYWG
jgi:hypothetical protein